jgi:hypothetical protein
LHPDRLPSRFARTASADGIDVLTQVLPSCAGPCANKAGQRAVFLPWSAREWRSQTVAGAAHFEARLRIAGTGAYDDSGIGLPVANVEFGREFIAVISRCAAASLC